MRGRAGALLLLAAALVLVAVAPAAARTGTGGPRVSFYFPQTQLDAGAPLGYTFRISRVPRSVHAYLQREVGPGARFETVARLRGHSGHSSIAGMPMGRYGYRLAVFQGRSFIGATSILYTYVYGPVSAARLCAAGAAQFTGGCAGGSVSVGGQPFSYSASDSSGNTSWTGAPAVLARSSSCRQATITYAVSDASRATTAVYADVEQSPGDQQAARTARGTLGILSATITSPDWTLVFFGDTQPPTVFWDGTFMCWTPDGRA